MKAGDYNKPLHTGECKMKFNNEIISIVLVSLLAVVALAGLFVQLARG